MESNTSPINIPGDKQPRRPSNFLSLSPYENPASPPSSATIPEKEASKPSPTLSPVALSSVTAPSDTNKSRRSSSASRSSASDNGFRFLKLGHAKPGDELGDWVE